MDDKLDEDGVERATSLSGINPVTIVEGVTSGYKRTSREDVSRQTSWE